LFVDVKFLRTSLPKQLPYAAESDILLSEDTYKSLRNRHLSVYTSQGNGPIQHVETCPDFFFSPQECTQQNPLSKF
jgi:hypothetical protein